MQAESLVCWLVQPKSDAHKHGPTRRHKLQLNVIHRIHTAVKCGPQRRKCLTQEGHFTEVS